MASIMNTDLTDLYNQWGQRVAFNEGYAKQKLVEANHAGREAFHLGLDRVQARDQFFQQQDQRFAEAQEFLNTDNTEQITDESITDVEPEPAIEPESIEPDPVGEVLDGEDTLGMESCVANETEALTDQDFINGDPWGLDTMGGMSEDQQEWATCDTYQKRSDFWSARGENYDAETGGIFTNEGDFFDPTPPDPEDQEQEIEFFEEKQVYPPIDEWSFSLR